MSGTCSMECTKYRCRYMCPDSSQCKLNLVFDPYIEQLINKNSYGII